jgi:hypothetical protein
MSLAHLSTHHPHLPTVPAVILCSLWFILLICYSVVALEFSAALQTWSSIPTDTYFSVGALVSLLTVLSEAG